MQYIKSSIISLTYCVLRDNGLESCLSIRIYVHLFITYTKIILMSDFWFFSLSDATNAYTKQLKNFTGNLATGSPFYCGKMPSASWDEPDSPRSV